MMRFLDGLVLLKEIDSIPNLGYSSKSLQKKYPNKIVVIRHISYIYKEMLCEIAQGFVTSLDEYVQLSEFAEKSSIRKEVFTERIKFMKTNNTKLFDYMLIENIYFLKIDTELKYLLEHYQPFYANLKNTNLAGVKLLGDLKIGFY